MAEAESGEKTEEATQQRREDFRKRGQVAQTRELAPVLTIGVTLLMIWFVGIPFMNFGSQLLEFTITSGISSTARSEDWLYIAKSIFLKTTLGLLPVLIVFWIANFLATVLQVGFLYNEEAMTLKFERLDPVAGFGRIFGWRSLVEGIKAVIKVVVVSIIVYMVLKSEVLRLPTLIEYNAQQLIFYVGVLLFKVFGGVLVVLVALAGLDYFFQRWDLEQQMRMTKHEVKEELKSREGDPLIKARIRRVQRQLAQKRMMEDVKTADVIVTNPTHIAVALKYDETMVAPRVVAMGADLIAERIKQLAAELAIPVVENKPLARAIYKTLKVGQSIPRELYTAVAEVLSYVYKLRRDQKGRI